MAFGAVGALGASGYASALSGASGAAGSSLWSSGSFWGGLASAAGSVAGGLLGYSASAEAAHVQRETMRQYMKLQARENQVNRDWTEEMSNTAHQREVADLRAAGLNPILSATGGNGASTPTVSSNILGAQDQSAGIELQGALNLANALASLGDKLSNIDLNSSMSKKARADAVNSLAEASLVPERQRLLGHQAAETFSRSMLNTENTLLSSSKNRLASKQIIHEDAKTELTVGKLQQLNLQYHKLQEEVNYVKSMIDVNSARKKLFDVQSDMGTSQKVKNYSDAAGNAFNLLKLFL